MSGGRLGGAVFTSLIADRLNNPNYVCDGRINGVSAKLFEKTQNILGEDFLGPVLGGMLFSDFVQRLWLISNS